MNNVLIRIAKESDLPTIRKLAREFVDSVENREGISKDVVSKNSRNVLKDPSSYILLAEIDGKAVGFIHFTTRTTIIHSGPSGLIDELAVSKRYREKGVGKELISAAVEKCKKLGCCEAEVSTEFTNTSAREFYKRIGFEERGVIFEKDLS